MKLSKAAVIKKAKLFARRAKLKEAYRLEALANKQS